MKKFELKDSFLQKQVPALILFLSVFIVYWNSIHNAFLWDDIDGILTNTYVHEWKYFLNFFSEGMYAGSGSLSYYWRPIVLSIFSIEWHIFHEWVVGYHIINILLHATNAILIFYLFRLIFNKALIAFVSALLFAIHPLDTEVTAYISGIADPLSTFFILSGSIAYFKSRVGSKYTRLFLLATILSFMFALMTKESSIMMPGLLVLVDFFALKNNVFSWRDIRAYLKKIFLFLCILTLYIASRLTVLNFVKDLPPSPLALPLYERILTFFHAFSVYFSLIFVPLHLHMERALPVGKTLLSLPVAIGGILLIIFLSLIITQYKKRPEVSFGLAWFLIALSPNMNIFIPTTAILSEHWLYLSLPGFFLAFFSLIEESFHNTFLRPILPALFIAWVVWLGNLTILRNRDWVDPIVLFTSTLKEAPYSYRANIKIGTAYSELGENKTALLYFEHAITLLPNESTAYYERGGLYKKIGQENDSIQEYERSFRLDPLYSPSFRLLVDYFMSHGEYKKARVVLETRLQKTRDPVEKQKLLLELFNTATLEHNDVLKKAYSELLSTNEIKINDSPMIKFGNYMNKYLD